MARFISSSVFAVAALAASIVAASSSVLWPGFARQTAAAAGGSGGADAVFIQAAGAELLPVTITIDATQTTGPLKPIWRWCGYDEPNYTYMDNGKKLIGQFTGDKAEVQRLGPAYFRAHNLLVTGDGTPKLKWGSSNAYTEDAEGRPVYSWTILDRIFDTYIEAGAKPFVQIGFMPKALSLRPEPYEHNWKPGDNYNDIYLGWNTPPNDYDKWRELNFQWARHCVEKYGMEEVEKWYWELWNEPNINYLSASTGGYNMAQKIQDYIKMYDYAADGIRRAIPQAIIGGAETAGWDNNFQSRFIEHCINGTNHATGQKGSPLGLIAFHAKGAPQYVDTTGTVIRGGRGGGAAQGYVRMGLQNQLAVINTGFRTIAARPETKPLPIVIGESDPDGCAACASANGLYPEYGYRNTSLFASYTIEQLVRTLDLADRHGVNILGSVTWAFEFENQPIFGGFRALATGGIELPVLNTFRMLNKMGTQRLEVTSTGDVGLDAILGSAGGGAGGAARGARGRGGVRGAQPDIHALASRDERRLTVITWHYHDLDMPGPAGDVTIALSGLPEEIGRVKLTEWRIDEQHSNAHTMWKKLGSPPVPNAEEYRQLEAAAKLAVFREPSDVAIQTGKLELKLSPLPRQGLSLVELTW